MWSGGLDLEKIACFLEIDDMGGVYILPQTAFSPLIGAVNDIKHHSHESSFMKVMEFTFNSVS